jgi:hypothetical protein
MTPPASLIHFEDFHFHHSQNLSELCARVHLLEKTNNFGIFMENRVTKKGTPVTKSFLPNYGKFRGYGVNATRFGFVFNIAIVRYHA